VAVLSHEKAQEILSPMELEFPNKTILLFDFDVVDLGLLEARVHARIPNPATLALSAWMRCRSEERAAKSAVRWIRKNAGRLGIDPERIAAGGGSAGGYLSQNSLTIGPGPRPRPRLGPGPGPAPTK